MPVQAEHRFPLDLSVLDAAGSRVTLAGLRGQARAVAVYFMRTGTCPVCIQHARTLARLDLPTHDVQPVVVVPGPPTHAARVRRILGDRVTVVSSAGAQAHLAAGRHRTLLLHAAASCSPTRPASCDTGWRGMPTAASTAQRCRPRSTGCKAPTILPQRAAKG